MQPIEAMTSDPEVQHGTPCFTGTRVPVKALFDALTHGRSIDQFLTDFPSVRREHAIAVLERAAAEVGQPGKDNRAA